MSQPLLFISHKHDDEAIASKVAKFVRTITGGQVDVYQSSTPEFEGPRVGKPLKDELRDALWRTDVVILVYTSQDKDWSWCMWECGLATVPDSPNTAIIVLRCLPDKPAVFEEEVHALAWDEDSMVSLAYRFGDEDLFPSLNAPATGLEKPELKEEGTQLFEELQTVIPETPSENWATWPFIRLEAPSAAIDELAERMTTQNISDIATELAPQVQVIASSSAVASLFGLVEISGSMSLSELVDQWEQIVPGRSKEWLNVMVTQMLDGAQKTTPRISSWARFRPSSGDAEYIPLVGRVKRDLAVTRFDCYLADVGDVPEVTSRMTRTDNMLYKDIDQTAVADLGLLELLEELEDHNQTRMPILEKGAARYIVHMSMIDRFVRKRTFGGMPSDEANLQDLLDDPDMGEMFANTFAVIGRDATIADAKAAIQKIENCADVFVTETGDRAAKVVGWLTDRDLVTADL